MPDISIDTSYLTRTLVELVRLNSINPDLSPGAPGEKNIAAYVANNLLHLGLDVTTLDIPPGRPSILATLRGSGGGPSLMLNGHLDTVGIEQMPDPFSADIREGRLYGRGAYDMKASIAAAMAALKALSDARVPLRGDVVLAAVADEEVASQGTAAILQHLRVDSAIVTEPTELELCVAHRGFIWLEVQTIGRAAHGSRYDLGIDANMRMGRVLCELEQLERELRARPPHPLVGPPSLHAARLHGGTEPSTYAASCRLQIERRTIPGETEAGVRAEVQAILDRLAAADPTFQATLTTGLVRDPMEVATGAPIVQAVMQAAANVLGAPPPTVGRPFWMDAALLSNAGIPTVVIGPAGAGAHAGEEWVDLASAVALAQILAQAAYLYCSSRSQP